MGCSRLSNVHARQRGYIFNRMASPMLKEKQQPVNGTPHKFAGGIYAAPTALTGMTSVGRGARTPPQVRVVTRQRAATHVGGGVPAPPRNVAAGKRAIPTNPANPPLFRRFMPPSLMGEGFEKNVHRPKFIIDFSRSLCRTGVYFSLLTKAVSLCYLVIG